MAVRLCRGKVFISFSPEKKTVGLLLQAMVLFQVISRPPERLVQVADHFLSLLLLRSLFVRYPVQCPCSQLPICFAPDRISRCPVLSLPRHQQRSNER